MIRGYHWGTFLLVKQLVANCLLYPATFTSNSARIVKSNILSQTSLYTAIKQSLTPSSDLAGKQSVTLESLSNRNVPLNNIPVSPNTLFSYNSSISAKRRRNYSKRARKTPKLGTTQPKLRSNCKRNLRS